MIKVCLYQENFSPGCMTHHLRNIAKYIDRQRFELYLATCCPLHDCYSDEIEKFFPFDSIHRIYRAGSHFDVNAATGVWNPAPIDHPLYDWLLAKNIDVLHDVSRGGGPQWPLNATHIKAKRVDSNAFAGVDIHSGLAKTMCISEGVYEDWKNELGRQGRMDMVGLGTVVYPAVDYPETDEDLRKELGIADDVVVVGRSSMGYAGDTANFISYSRIETPKTLFLTTFLNEAQQEFVKSLGIRNIVVMDRLITSYELKSKFYNAFDIAAHNRGESFGCSVAEPMIHGKPVVTVGACNGQRSASIAHEELIEDPSYCAFGRTQDEVLADYTRILQRHVIHGRSYCKKQGEAFRARAEAKFAAPNQVRKVEAVYREVIAGKVL